jgi:hypothetical protein
MDCGRKISGCFVIAHRNREELLEPAEEVLYQMPRLTEIPVMGTGILPATIHSNKPPE